MTERKKLMNFYVSEEEREIIRRNAAWFGLSISEYVRRLALRGYADAMEELEAHVGIAEVQYL